MVDIYHSLATHLWNHARIRLHQGKTVVWNKAGSVAGVAVRWRMLPGAQIPTLSCEEGNVLLEPELQGLVVLGVSVGRPEFIFKLEAKSRQHNVLLDRITSVGDLQSAWCLLLNCAAARVSQTCDSQDGARRIQISHRIHHLYFFIHGTVFLWEI